MNDGRGGGVDRRRLLSLGGTVLAASSLPVAASAAKPVEAPVEAGPQYVTIVEGTNIAVTAAPDGKAVAFDLFGVMWSVSIEGGAATRLTDDLTDGAQPDWSPDCKTLAFQSYRDGNFHIWTVGADGAGLKQLTKGPYDCREPRWSPDGKTIAFSSDTTGPYAIHVLDVATGAIRLWAQSKGQACEPCWSPDGSKIAFAVDRARIEMVDALGKSVTAATLSVSADRMNPTELHSPSFTPDGADIVYHVLANGVSELRGSKGALVRGEDIFPFRPTWLPGGDLVYAADGKIKRRGAGGVKTIEFSLAVPVRKPSYAKKQRDYDTTKAKPVVGIGSPALSPDGKQVAFRALNDLWIMPLGGKPTALVKDSFWKCDPAWSPDGKLLAFSTDRAGSLDIWVRDLATGADRQVTRHAGAAVSAAWSKDGKQIAFLDQTGSLHTVDVATGAIKQRFGAIWEPGKPTWSLDGQTIALAAFKPYNARFREGLSEIMTVDVATGAATYQPHAPNKSLGTRGDDGPVWSPDGKSIAYVFASRLWTVEVDAKGKFTSAPRALTDEVTDAPTWSGDSSQLLYLSGGKLNLIAAAGGSAKTIPVPLTWANAKPKGKTVIRAGKLWDGLGPDLKRDVDIVVDGNRIAAILPAGQGPTDAKLIDAKDATVIPGLVEIHAHRQMQGYGYGDREGRLWLALGITTTRSPGSPAYHMVEDRESLDAGARVGPRYFSTGEAIDGSRIYYNFMRPVTEPDQMQLELDRAEALSYDLLKSYVRLPLAASREITEWAHARGMHVTSHYHYPAVSFGLDGMEHIGATSRFGYSRTTSPMGTSYQDVTALFVHSGARRTPTLFSSSAMYGTDRSLVDDPRIKALYPPWEYARLLERAEQAAAGDPSVALSSLAQNVEHLRDILRSGGRVVTGTDSPIDFNGISLHMNLRAMVKYGLTPYEALTTATRFSGEFLDQPFGTLTVGALADLVVTEGNPLVRIEDAAAVRHVMKGGEVFDIATLIAPFKDVAHAEVTPVKALAARKGGQWWHEAAYVESGRAACCVDPFCAVQQNGRRRFVAVEV
ncbi:PD40 domain-containing protein [Phenylobacterium sp. 20VBR1]|uniref:PD40 domain-containing protein n=1 Tax=Phenylobacterium glaciei TaxID=2803784 RepID=A0A941CZW0_9CAUL|nr:amidohydrolase family protein [Phenylobacterium glaciei]MBR7619750.1 PD40 domain-containing protein [Phenylobacterium glaciei]